MVTIEGAFFCYKNMNLLIVIMARYAHSFVKRSMEETRIIQSAIDNWHIFPFYRSLRLSRLGLWSMISWEN